MSGGYTPTSKGDEQVPEQPTMTITPDTPVSDDVLVTMPDGLTVRICRVPLDGKPPAESTRTQLSVFINTEDMVTDHYDAETGASGGINGTPEMQVVLNDATLYDREPA